MAKYYLIPGNNGENCIGNGRYIKSDGTPIRCRCGNCKFKSCCIKNKCQGCQIKKCPRRVIIKHIKRKRRLNRLSAFFDNLFYESLYAPYPEAFIDKFLD